MSDNEYERARQEGFDAAISLARAIQRAGGTIPEYAVLKEEKLIDFICRTAAQNNIRFFYVPREKPIDEDGKPK